MKYRSAAGFLIVTIIVAFGLMISFDSSSAKEGATKILDAKSSRTNKNGGLDGTSLGEKQQYPAKDHQSEDLSFLSQGVSASAVRLQRRGQAESMFKQASGRTENEKDLDGPDVIRDRIKDYRRRHGMGSDFDSNQRLQLVREHYAN